MLLDKPRNIYINESVIKNRKDLSEYFYKMGFVKGAEIGVAEGKYSEVLFQKNPNLQLICVDIWKNERIFEEAKKRLANYNVKLFRKSSMEAVNDVPNNSLDFVFIDADHKYEAVLEDITHWSKKVKKGGIVSGHDYYVFHYSRNRGVIDAVDEYVRNHNVKLYVTRYGPKGIRREERVPIWYFVKSV